MSSRRAPLGRWAEIGVVVLLLVGSAWLGRLLVHNYVLHRDEPQAPGPRLAPASVPATALDGTAGTLLIAGQERPTVLLVLSTECGFCRQNMPNWVRLVERLPGAVADGPRVITLSVDSGDITSEYLRAHGLDTEVRLVQPEVLQRLGLTGYPGTVLVDPISRELRPYAGVLREADLEQIVRWAAALTDPALSSLGGGAP